MFFTLFGAVAIVGVLGAGIMATMRGPLSTMVEVNRRTQAEVQMSIASKLAMMESLEQAASGDCDADGFVEPMEYDAAIAGTGGGTLPTNIGSNRQDPWGTDYLYCAWDAGPTVDPDGGNCTGTLLKGDDGTGQTYSVIAVISAGPDGSYDTTCNDYSGPNTTLTEGGDDLVLEYDYQSASAATGGLWSIKSGDPDAAEIQKNIDLTAPVAALGGISPQLRLGASSMLLPTQIELFTCDMANENLLRINTGTDPDALEICNEDDAAPGNYAWESVAAGVPGINLWSMNGNDIYYSSGNVGIGLSNPDDALDVVGNLGVTVNIELGGNLEMANGASVVWASGADVTENSGAIQIDSDGGAGVELTVDDNSVAIAGDTTITGTTADDTAKALEVFNSTPTSIFLIQNDGDVGINAANPDDKLEVGGFIDSDASYKIDDSVVLHSDTTMGDSIMLGKAAGTNVTGDNNTILGAGAAATLTDGDGNIIIGAGSSTPLAVPDVPGASVNDYLNIGNVIFGDLANKRIGIGFADSSAVSGYNDALEVSGNIDATGTINATGNITGGINITATGNVQGVDIIATDEIYVLTNRKLGPPADCDSDEKLEWADASGWSCVADLGGGSGGGGQDLADVLGIDNDAGGLDADNFDQVGANEFCNEDLTICFDPEAVGSGDGGKWENAADAGDIRYMSGQVGIGVADPDDALAVFGNINLTGNVEMADAQSVVFASGASIAGAAGLTLTGATAINGDTIITGSTNTAAADALIVQSNNGTDILVIENDANAYFTSALGIGTSSISYGGMQDLIMDVEGPIGGTFYCDENGDNCFTAASVAGGSAPGNDGEIHFTSGGATTTDPNFVFTSAGRFGLGTATPAGTMHIKNDQDSGTFVLMENLDGGTAATASFAGFSDTGAFSLNAHGSGRILNRYGQTIGGWNELYSPSGNGLLIGTGNNAPLIIGTNSLSRIFIEGGGNVGIGTDTPGTLLDVDGSIKISYRDAICADGMEGAIRYNSSTDAVEYCEDNGASEQWTTVASGGTPAAAGSDTEIQFNSGDELAASSDFTFNDSTDILFVSGRMGIGISNPAYSIQVGGNGAVAANNFYSAAGGGNGFKYGVGTDAAGLGHGYGWLSNVSGGGSSGTYLGNAHNIQLTGLAGQYALNFIDDGVAGAAHTSKFAVGLDGSANPIIHSGSTLDLMTDGSTRIDISATGLVDMLGTLKINYSGETCADGLEGAMRYNSATDAIEYCEDNGASEQWTTVAAGGTPAAAGSDREIQFNSNGALETDTNFVFTSAGNFGVGTASPSANLHIVGDAVFEGGSPVAVNNGASGAYFQKTPTTFDIVNGYDTTRIQANADIEFETYPAGGPWTTRAVLKEDGKFGIGTTNPATTLDVDGLIKLAYNGEDCVDGLEGAVRYDSSNDTYYLCEDNGGSEQWVEIATGSISAPGNDGEIHFTSGGTTATDGNFVFTSAGNFGVGTSTPSSALHGVTTLDNATGNEVAFELDYTVNKATSGNDTGLLISMTDTASPGSSYGIDYKVGGTSVFNVGNNGHTQVGSLGSSASVGSNPLRIYGTNYAGNIGSAVLIANGNNMGPVTGQISAALEVMGGNFTPSSGSGKGYTLMVTGSAVQTGTSTGTLSGIFVNPTLGSSYDYRAIETGGYTQNLFGTPPTTLQQVLFNAPTLAAGGATTVTNAATQVITGAPVAGTNVTITNPYALWVQDGTSRFDGTIQVGYDTPCADGLEGAIRYNSSTDVMEICEDNSGSEQWVNVANTGAVSGAAGSNMEIQFNSGDDFAADSDFRWDDSADILYVSGSINLESKQGTDNLLVGFNAGSSLTTGNSNILIGREAGRSKTIQANNIAIGHGALANGIGGSNVLAIGNSAGLKNNGDSNIFVGYGAGLENTSGTQNIFIGGGAQNGTGAKNTAVGISALGNFAATGDAYNTALGFGALQGSLGSSTGTQNTALGSLAGNSITTGSSNILVGYDADVPAPTTSNYINIGNLYYGSADVGFAWVPNEFKIGTGSLDCVDGFEGAIRYNSSSDSIEFCEDNGASEQWVNVANSGGGSTAPGNDGEIHFTSGGTTTTSADLVFTSTGRLGIGTNTPNAHIQVEDTTGKAQVLLSGLGDVNHYSTFVWQELASGNQKYWAQIYSKTNDKYLFEHYDGTNYNEWFTILGNGNTGIGVPAPVAKLDVDGPIKMSYNGESCVDGMEGALHYDSASDKLYLCEDNGASEAWAEVGGGGAAAAAGANGYVQYYSGGNLAAEQAFLWDDVNNELELEGAIRIRGNSATCDGDFVGGMKYSSAGDKIMYCADNGGSYAWQDINSGTTLWSIGVANDIFYNSGSDPRVGIGTATPGAMLEVAGSMIVGSVVGEPAPSSSITGYIDDLLDVDTSGKVSGNILRFNGVDWVAGSTDSVWTVGDPGEIYYNSGGATRVGIGTASPGAMLEVTGSMIIGSISGEPAPTSSVSTALADLTDVDVSGVLTNQFLKFDGTDWVPATASSQWVNGANDDLYYNSGAAPQVGIGTTTPGAMLEVAGSMIIGSISGEPAPTSITSNALVDLVDVNATGLTTNDFLQYDGAEWVPVSGVSQWVNGANDDIYYNSGGAPQVGIGTTSPGAMFEVAGPMIIGPISGLPAPNSSFGGSGNAAGNTGEIQFKSGADFASSIDLVWDIAEGRLELGGTLKIADGGESCIDGLEGSIVYTSDSIYYCQDNGDSEQWVDLAGGGGGALADLSDTNITTPLDGDSLVYDFANSEWIPESQVGTINCPGAVGTSCGGGLYAGDTNLVIADDQDQQSYTQVTGERKLEGASSTTNGATNTIALVDPGDNNQAAAYCDTLSYGGEDDWYLPARDELLTIQGNMATLNAALTTDVDSSIYWSSTEVSSTNATVVQMWDGGTPSTNKVNNNRLRCVRRHSATSAYEKWKKNGEDIYYEAGDVGININTPSALFHMWIPEDDSLTNQALFGTDTYGAFIGNNSASGFAPIYYGLSKNSTDATYFSGRVPVAADSGSLAALILDARRDGNAALVTRPLLSVANNGSVVMAVNASGKTDFAGTVQIADGGESCASGLYGALKYDSSSDSVFYCKSDDNWVDLAGGGGGSIEFNDLTDAFTDYATTNNIFFGSGSGNGVTATGTDNLAIGYQTGDSLTTGQKNILLGTWSGQALNEGSANVALGDLALMANTKGSKNVAIGLQAMEGFNNTVLADTYNTAVGAYALKGALNNTAVENTAIGGSAGLSVSTGTDNVFVGYQAGDSVNTGINNILIGSGADAPAPGSSNHLNIGNLYYGSSDIGFAWVPYEFKIGTGSLSCADGVEGALRYNSSTDAIEYCQDNGASEQWTSVSSNSVGTLYFTSSLSDTPSSYSGEAGKYVRVNSGATGVEFTELTANGVTGEPAPDTIDLGDLGDVDTTGFADGEVLLYSAGAGGWVSSTVPTGSGGLWSAGTGNEIYYNSGAAPYVGIGLSNPDVLLDVAGEIQISAGDLDCDDGFEGALKYDSSSDSIFLCVDNSGNEQWAGLAGSSSLLNLTDTPGSYAGEGGKYLRIVSGETGVEFTNQIVSSVSGQPAPNAFALNDLDDVDTSGAASGNVLSYDGSDWVASSNAGGLWTTGSDNDIYYNSGASPYVGIGVTDPDVALDISGDIEYTGTITDVSDVRLKDNITPLNKRGSMLDKLGQIDTYSFTMKDDEKRRTEFGVIAQELEEIFPDLVKTANDEMGTKSVNYVGLIAPMIEAAKELKAENDVLKAELASMQTERAEITDAVADLSKQVELLNKAAGQNVDKAGIDKWYILALLFAIGMTSAAFFMGGALRGRKQHTK